VLLDDLLVAEDLAAVETTPAALHAAAAAASPHSLPSHKPQEVRKSPHPDSQGADGSSVLVANPVAAPVNGDTSMDISTENAVSHGHRYDASD
jgi:protein phosphatase